MKYYDDKINIDFELPEYLRKTIQKLINERKNNGLMTDCYEEDLLSDCNQAYNEGIITMEQVQLLRRKFL
jgi:hypothetical protein